MDTQFIDGDFDGYLDGKMGREGDTKGRSGSYQDGYFHGFARGKEDAVDRGTWSGYFHSPRTENTHDWEESSACDAGNTIEEIVEKCNCGAKRWRLVARGQDGEVMRDYTFLSEPNPLVPCPCSGRNP